MAVAVGRPEVTIPQNELSPNFYVYAVAQTSSGSTRPGQHSTRHDFHGKESALTCVVVVSSFPSLVQIIREVIRVEQEPGAAQFTHYTV